MTPATKNENRLVTVGYGIATHHLANGDMDRACMLLKLKPTSPIGTRSG